MEDSPENLIPEQNLEPVAGEGWQEIAIPLPPVGILAMMSDQSLLTLAPYGEYSMVHEGQKLIEEGQMQDRLYVVVSGKLKIYCSNGDENLPLGTAEPGECLGEVSVLEPGLTTATVEAVEESVLWSMNLDHLRLYLSEHAGGGGALMMGMAQCLGRRLNAANQLIGKSHVPPIAPALMRQDRAITAESVPVQVGFFDRLKKSMGGGEKKVQISTQIKL